MTLNIITKNPVAVPPYEIPNEKSFTCDTVTVRLDPYDMDCLTLEEERGYVVIKHNDRVVTQIRVEEP